MPTTATPVEAPTTRAGPDVAAARPRGGSRRRGAVVFGVTFAVLAAWWLAYWPGIMTNDSRQQWEQARAWEFVDWHPVFHTWLIAVATRIWTSPAVVGLLHALGVAAVLASLSWRLERARVAPAWATVAPIAIALSPAVGSMVPVLWKDVPFGIAVLWVFAEVLDLAADPERYTRRWWRPARLGVALALVIGFRHNGVLVSALVVVAVLVTFRRCWRALLVTVAVVVLGGAAVQVVLPRALEATDTPVLFTLTTFVHDMGAFVDEHWDEMTPAEQAFLGDVLPYESWKQRYTCEQATALIFAPEFTTEVDHTGQPPVVADNPQSAFLDANRREFQDLWWRFARRWPGTLAGHRACVGSLAWSPWHRSGLEVLAPPGETSQVPPGFYGPALDPRSDWLHDRLEAVRTWWGAGAGGLTPFGDTWRRAVTWRFSGWCYLGFAAVALGAARRRDRALLVVAVPGFSAWASVVLFTPGQSARYLWAAYLCALASLPLATRPRAAVAGDEAGEAGRDAADAGGGGSAARGGDGVVPDASAAVFDPMAGVDPAAIAPAGCSGLPGESGAR